MWTFIHRPRNTGADPVKLSGPTGRFYTLFQASTANCFCSDSAFVSSRELSLKIRAARIRGSFVQLSPPRLALTEAIRGNCAIKVPFRAYVLVISLAATQLSCGGGGSSAAPPPKFKSCAQNEPPLLGGGGEPQFQLSNRQSRHAFLNGLLPRAALATQYFANAHPSLPNSFMLTTGQPITLDDSFSGPVSQDNIVRELIAAGKSWKSYAE